MSLRACVRDRAALTYRVSWILAVVLIVGARSAVVRGDPGQRPGAEEEPAQRTATATAGRPARRWSRARRACRPRARTRPVEERPDAPDRPNHRGLSPMAESTPVTTTQTLEKPSTADADTGDQLFHYVRKAKIAEPQATVSRRRAARGKAYSQAGARRTVLQGVTRHATSPQSLHHVRHAASRSSPCARSGQLIAGVGVSRARFSRVWWCRSRASILPSGSALGGSVGRAVGAFPRRSGPRARAATPSGATPSPCGPARCGGSRSCAGSSSAPGRWPGSPRTTARPRPDDQYHGQDPRTR